MTGFDLIVLERARDSLASCPMSMEEAKQLRSVADAAQPYARCRGLAAEVQDLAAEVKVRAERNLGLLLSAMERRGRDEYPRGEPSPDQVNASGQADPSGHILLPAARESEEVVEVVRAGMTEVGE